MSAMLEAAARAVATETGYHYSGDSIIENADSSKRKATTMIDHLGTHAAMALRDATEAAIKDMERRISGEPPGGPQRDYFVAQMKEFREAIEELRVARRDLHRRVFESMNNSTGKVRHKRQRRARADMKQRAEGAR